MFTMRQILELPHRSERMGQPINIGKCSCSIDQIEVILSENPRLSGLNMRKNECKNTLITPQHPRHQLVIIVGVVEFDKHGVAVTLHHDQGVAVALDRSTRINNHSTPEHLNISSPGIFLISLMAICGGQAFRQVTSA